MAILKTFVPSVFTDLQNEVVTLNKKETFIRHRDIHFVLADNVFNDIDPTQVKQFLSPLQSAFENVDANFTDDQLAQFCKSRYIQEASDVQIYADNLSKFSKHLSKYAKSLKNSKDDSSKNSPASSSSSASQATTSE